MDWSLVSGIAIDIEIWGGLEYVAALEILLA